MENFNQLPNEALMDYYQGLKSEEAFELSQDGSGDCTEMISETYSYAYEAVLKELIKRKMPIPPELLSENYVINIKDGRTVIVEEEVIKGMAGEPMTIILYKIGDQFVKLSDFIDLMEIEDRLELDHYLECIRQSNDSSTISFII